MLVPVLDDDEDDELRRDHGQDEVVVDMVGVVIIKINNLLLALSLVVACFIQFSTMDVLYLNSLMWGRQDEDGYFRISSDHDDVDNNNDTATTITATVDWTTTTATTTYEEIRMSSKSLLTFQSISAILMLSFLRAVVFPNLNNNNNNNNRTSTFEALLNDLLFHIKVRLGIGLLCCLTSLPFPYIETTVVCFSVVLQLASSSITV